MRFFQAMVRLLGVRGAVSYRFRKMDKGPGQAGSEILGVHVFSPPLVRVG